MEDKLSELAKIIIKETGSMRTEKEIVEILKKKVKSIHFFSNALVVLMIIFNASLTA
jgi:hypothetical protein